MSKSRSPRPQPVSRRRAGAQARPDAAPAPEPRRDPGPPPFSRLADVRALPAPGVEVRIEANEAERAALARLLETPAVESLEGVFRLKPGSGGQVLASGRVRARVVRECVVTLESFVETLDEDVEVVFAPHPERAPAHRALTAGRGGREEDVDMASLAAVDPPDPIVDGKVDLGALSAEFVSLGLDPYPRKPGATFESADDTPPDAGPFAGLAGRPDGGGDDEGGDRSR
jgi:hypothetical protein